jgi:hypothetical protein
MSPVWPHEHQALEAVSNMSAGRQDLLAAELIERLGLLEQPLTRLSPEERAELEVALAIARGLSCSNGRVRDNRSSDRHD